MPSTLFLFLTLSICLCSNSFQITQIPSNGTPPPKRFHHGYTFNPAENTLYIYGGISGSEYLEDMWEYNFNTNQWREIHFPSVINPGPRFSPYMKMLPDGKNFILYGGVTSKGPTADMWIFNIDTYSWAIYATENFSPVSSMFSGASFYYYKDRIYFACFGGTSFKGRHNRLIILDTLTKTWYEPEYTGNPPEEVNSSFVYYLDGSIYIFGGTSYSGLQNNILYRFELDTSKWESIPIYGETLSLINYQIVEYKTCLYAFYGLNPKGSLSEHIYKIDFALPVYAWELVDVEKESDYNDVMPRVESSMIASNGNIIMFGGRNDRGEMNDLVIFDMSNRYIASSTIKYEFINRVTNIPPSRLGHRMEFYEDKLLVFGGRDKKYNFLLDIWGFDLNTEKWNPYVTQGYIPKGRSDFSHSKVGNAILMYGGLGIGGLLGDMYKLNLYNKEWQEVKVNSISQPSPRRGACMVSIDYFVLIFGGITEGGYTNELWQFNLDTGGFVLVQGTGDIPFATAYANCQVVKRNTESIIQIYTGETIGSLPSYYVYEFNTGTKVWTKSQSIIRNKSTRSKAASFLLEDKLLIIGGNRLDTVSSNEITSVDLNTFQSEVMGNMNTRTFHTAHLYYKDKIYIQGGGDSFSEYSLVNLPNNYFYSIQLNDKDSNQWPCSKGTYKKDLTCEKCPAGTYNEEIGSECLKCPSGYFSNSIASDSVNYCLPCSEGYYNPKEGQSICLQCSIGLECPIGTIEPIEYPTKRKEVSSSQPEVYSNPTDEDTLEIIDFIIISIVILLLLFFLISKKLKRYLKELDIFIYLHNHFLNEPMYIKKTYIGGLFSIGFLALATSIIFKFALIYFHQNIAETKVLVPLVTLENDYEHFIAKEMIFEFSFFGYGGKCVNEKSKCVDELNISIENIDGQFELPSCEDLQHTCFIRYSCKNCELKNSAKLSVVLSENLSFANKIRVNVTSSSSIPEEYSSISIFQASEYDHLFRGIEPTQFNLYLTPSLYLSDVPDWESELTGYHISQNKEPEVGSLASINNIAFTRNLRVDVCLDTNESALVTQRNIKQSFSIFLSSLIASIVGIMGAVGFGMRKTEAWHQRFLYKNTVQKVTEDKSLKEKQLLASFNHAVDLEVPNSAVPKSIFTTLLTEPLHAIRRNVLNNSNTSELNGFKAHQLKSCITHRVQRPSMPCMMLPTAHSCRVMPSEFILKNFVSRRPYPIMNTPNLSLNLCSDESISDIIYNPEYLDCPPKKFSIHRSIELLDYDMDY